MVEYNFANQESTTVSYSSSIQDRSGVHDQWEYIVARDIQFYGTTIITAVACLCNSASLITIAFLKPVTTSSIFVAVLAVADTIAVILKLTYQMLMRHNVPIGDGACGFLNTLGLMFVQYANWIVVAMTLERFVAIWFPFRVSDTITTKRVTWLVFAMGLLFFFINFQVSFFFEEREVGIRNNETDLRCVIKSKYQWYYLRVFYWVNTFLYAVIPCLVLIILNGLIIKRLKEAFREHRNLASGETGESYRQSQMQLTGMLVVVSACLSIMLMPVCVVHIIYSYRNIKTMTSEEVARMILLREISYTIANISHAVNFIFYFLSSRKFRRVFLQLLRCQPKIAAYTVSRTGNHRTSIDVRTNRLILSSRRQSSPMRDVHAIALKDFTNHYNKLIDQKHLNKS